MTSRLRGYAGWLAAFAGSCAAVAGAGWARGHEVPERFSMRDLLGGALAVHKFARLVTKDAVTSPIRVPFTRLDEAAGSSEVNEAVRSDESEARRWVGELLSCPFCLTPWIGADYVSALVIAQRAARAGQLCSASSGVSDVLQHLYARLRTD